MTELYDVIVVGAGIEGSATAYWLAKNGHKTLLIEQFLLPHSRGSSHGQSRIIRKAYEQDYYAKMMIECYKMWVELEKESSMHVFVQNVGLLTMCKKSSPAVDQTIDALKKINASYRTLTAAQIREQFPRMHATDDIKGVFDPEGGVMLPEKSLKAYQLMFQRFGGVIRDGEPVEEITPGEIVRIKTTKFTHRARTVVITVGPWANRLIKPLGLHLPLQPMAIKVLYWRSKLANRFTIAAGWPNFIAHHIAETSDGGQRYIYGLPELEYPNLVKICVHHGQKIDPELRDFGSDKYNEDIELAKKFVRQYFPDLEDEPSIIEKCIYTMTPDEDFVLDPHPKWRNIIIGAGFSGHGFKLAPVVGKILGELAVGASPSYDLKPFKIDRFFNNSKL